MRALASVLMTTRALASVLTRSVLTALVLASCAYDLGGFSSLDAAAAPEGGGAGCDPLALTGCGAALMCSTEAWSGAVEARCTVIASGAAGTPCAGAGVCGLGLVCEGTTEGDGVCTPYCGAGRPCPAPLACSSELVGTLDGRALFRCR